MLRNAPRSKTILALAVGTCLLFGLLVYGWQGGAFRRPQRVRLKVETLEGLATKERVGLEQILIHQLEVLGGLPVLRWPDPTAPESNSPPGQLFLRVGLRRQGGKLGFDVAWGPEGKQKQVVILPEAPEGAMTRLFEVLPLKLARSRRGVGWPLNEADFWDLVTSMGLIDIRSEQDQALALARLVVSHAPECAEAQINLGTQVYSHLQWKPTREAGLLDTAVSSFESGLASQPGHPWGTRDMAVMLTDMGRAKEALVLLSHAIAQRPRVPRLYEGLAYASRTTGLLDISRRAIRIQHWLALEQTRQVGETTFLYSEDYSAFLATCVPNGNPSDAKAHFYRGYVALARGDRAGALSHFQAATQAKEGWYGFEELAASLALHLEGKTGEARTRLAMLEQTRTGLRIPDGEFTFKQAEANAVMGNHEDAMDLANRAFAQGFSCVQWYERSPFLGPLRAHPRWVGLMQRAHERQAHLDGGYSPSDFGL